MSLIRPARDGRSGIASVEFALLVPILALMFVGVAETVIYLRSWYRLDRTAAEVANVTTQYETLTPSVVGQILDAASTLASPLSASNTTTDVYKRARTVISVVSGTASGNVLSWSCSRGDANLATQVAGRATLPNSMVVPTGQSVVVVEIINGARPWQALLRFFPEQVVADPGPIRTYSIQRPRIGTLNSLGGSCPT